MLAMKLVIPRLSLAPGIIIYLHIPHEFDATARDLEKGLLQLADDQGKKAAISRPAELAPRGVEAPLNQKSTEWLSHAGSISTEESEQIIAGLGVRVAE